jgi:hypothetical protein
MILRAGGRIGLALLLIGRIQVGGRGGKFRRAGIDALVDRRDAEFAALAAYRRLGRARQRRQAAVGEALALERAQPLDAQRTSPSRRTRASSAIRSWICARNQRSIELSSCDALEREAGAKRIGHVQQPVGPRRAQLVAQLRLALFRQRQRQQRIEAVEPGLQPAQRLLQRLLEGAADRHHLADRLHLRGQAGIGGGNFSKVKRGILVTT